MKYISTSFFVETHHLLNGGSRSLESEGKGGHGVSGGGGGGNEGKGTLHDRVGEVGIGGSGFSCGVGHVSCCGRVHTVTSRP